MADIDPAALTQREAYWLLTSLVVPRPIAWVSSLSGDGVRNLAPHSYFNIISSDPPIVHFTSTGTKDTLRNVTATREFVVNIVSFDLVEPMNLTSADFPAAEDEFGWAELEAVPSTAVAPERVRAAKAALECRLVDTLSLGNGTMCFGEVVAFHVADEIMVDGRVDVTALRPVGRLGGSGYVVVDEMFNLARPTWAQLDGQDG